MKIGNYREELIRMLGKRKAEFIATIIVIMIFAVSFAYLEYYFIKDPALAISNGKVVSQNPDSDRTREAAPIFGNMYQYHLFPMLFIFILISFVALFDDMIFRHFGAKRVQAVALGIGNLVAAITIEDLAWFVNRFLFPLEEDPKGGLLMQFSDWTSMHMGAVDLGTFVIPVWYIVAALIAGVSYFVAFRKLKK